MTDSTFRSPFQKEMRELVETKRAAGFKYDAGEKALLRLDAFLCREYPDVAELSRDVVLHWCEKRPWEKATNRSRRVSTIRQFAVFLRQCGQDAWVAPPGLYPKGEKYVPHIYTEDELRRFYTATDACHPCSAVPYRHHVMPEFFRLLLHCGLRCSEARQLKREDVDLESGVIRILDGKNHNDRLLPLGEYMTGRLRSYAETVWEKMLCQSQWFFPGRGGEPMTLLNVYRNFRRFLWQAGISHTGDGPRVHDFRHTFCVFRLREWARSGKDLTAFLPILETYLGHQDFADTAYYLQWTADVFPDIRIQIQSAFGGIIPTLLEVRA